ncbi:WG repeat-containing protein [Aureibaculum sp. A20]|uniref:WG repeat-containing protein n=1 Tax=Aureibaculum flavum TaxID=2795986 RepID=A0ABS0WLA4_9FLAO|nr:WG repeat-containing protein [Aureibaculum flavum]MBJ2172752.1 WG repeat-containing protein [Aureibaculum flavum]
MRAIVFFIIILNSINVFSQYNKDIYLYEKNNNVGFVDNNFKVIVKPIYEELGGFQEKFFGEYSIFKSDGKYGVLDLKGNQIITPLYTYLGNTNSPKFFYFKRNKKYGLVNLKGEEIIKPMFDYISALTDKGKSVIVKKDGKYGLVSINGKNITEFKYENISGDFDSKVYPFRKDNKYGYINRKGKEIIKPIYNHAQAFNDGFAIVSIDNKYGIINKKGEILIEPKYQNISYQYSFFHDHQFNVNSKLYYLKEGNKIGLMDKNLKVIILPTYNQIGNFNEGFAFVKKDNKYGFINEEGKLVIPLIYADADTFSEGLAPVVKNGKWGYIDKLGDIAIDFQFMGCVKPFFNGLAVYRNRNFKSSKAHYVGDKCGYIDLKGNIKIGLIFRNAQSFRNGVAKTEDEYSEYLINKNNKKIVLKSSEIEIMEVEGN